MNGDPVLEIESLKIGYGRKIVLWDLNLKAWPGEFISVAGPNGAGKTTLFKAILGLLVPYQGKVSVFGHELAGEKERRRARGQIGYVPQQTTPGKLPISVHDTVLMGRWGMSFSFGRKPGPKDIQITGATLAQVGLIHKQWCDCRYLSGGEQQKVAIARALAREAKLLLLDEPATFLDQASREDLLHLLKKLKLDQGLSMVVISHDPEYLAGLADRSFLLDGGKLRQISDDDGVNSSAGNWSKSNGIT
jgi:ABC-type Mn2+/Zn2+ transport system ATPase subunit